MTEPKDLLLLVEQLRRSNRRWKALASAACLALILLVVSGLFLAARLRVKAERLARAADAAVARAYQARAEAQRAAQPGQPR